MNNISFYLDKYNKIGQKEEKIKNLLIECIENITKSKISNHKIRIEKNHIVINIQGPQKTEILINKKQIQEDFDKKISNNNLILNKRKII